VRWWRWFYSTGVDGGDANKVRGVGGEIFFQKIDNALKMRLNFIATLCIQMILLIANGSV
jgi:hypothetical protein